MAYFCVKLLYAQFSGLLNVLNMTIFILIAVDWEMKRHTIMLKSFVCMWDIYIFCLRFNDSRCNSDYQALHLKVIKLVVSMWSRNFLESTKWHEKFRVISKSVLSISSIQRRKK